MTTVLNGGGKRKCCRSEVKTPAVSQGVEAEVDLLFLASHNPTELSPVRHRVNSRGCLKPYRFPRLPQWALGFHVITEDGYSPRRIPSS